MEDPNEQKDGSVAPPIPGAPATAIKAPVPAAGPIPVRRGLACGLVNRAQKRWKKIRTAVNSIRRALTLAVQDRTEFESSSKDALSEALSGSGGVALAVEKKEDLSKINYMSQGDASLYTPEMLTARHALRRNAKVIGAVREWWAWLPKNKAPAVPASAVSGSIESMRAAAAAGSTMAVTKEVYCALASMLQEVLLPKYGVEPDPDYHPGEDWDNDSKGEAMMDFPNLFDSLFELADVWADGVEATDYAALLNGVLQGFKDNKDRFDALLKRYGYKGPDKDPPAPPPLRPVSQSPSPAEDELGPSNDNAQDYQRKPKQPPPVKPAVKAEPYVHVPDAPPEQRWTPSEPWLPPSMHMDTPHLGGLGPNGEDTRWKNEAGGWRGGFGAGWCSDIAYIGSGIVEEIAKDRQLPLPAPPCVPRLPIYDMPSTNVSSKLSTWLDPHYMPVPITPRGPLPSTPRGGIRTPRQQGNEDSSEDKTGSDSDLGAVLEAAAATAAVYPGAPAPPVVRSIKVPKLQLHRLQRSKTAPLSGRGPAWVLDQAAKADAIADADADTDPEAASNEPDAARSVSPKDVNGFSLQHLQQQKLLAVSSLTLSPPLNPALGGNKIIIKVAEQEICVSPRVVPAPAPTPSSPRGPPSTPRGSITTQRGVGQHVYSPSQLLQNPRDAQANECSYVRSPRDTPRACQSALAGHRASPWAASSRCWAERYGSSRRNSFSASNGNGNGNAGTSTSSPRATSSLTGLVAGVSQQHGARPSTAPGPQLSRSLGSRSASARFAPSLGYAHPSHSSKTQHSTSSGSGGASPRPLPQSLWGQVAQGPVPATGSGGGMASPRSPRMAQSARSFSRTMSALQTGSGLSGSSPGLGQGHRQELAAAAPAAAVNGGGAVTTGGMRLGGPVWAPRVCKPHPGNSLFGGFEVFARSCTASGGFEVAEAPLAVAWAVQAAAGEAVAAAVVAEGLQ